MSRPSPSPRVVSVNRGPARDEEWAGNLRRTAIDKRPVEGPVAVGVAGLAGDEVADLVHHGGPDQAVYVYALEDLRWWGEQLGGELRPGMVGENLTTEGIDVNAALVGERWQVGEPGVGPLLEVSAVRIPCRVFANFLDLHGLDALGLVKRFTQAGRVGPYLRVLRPGSVRAGDAVRVVARPQHAVSVTTMFRALTTERHLLPDLLAIEDLAERVRRRVDEHLAARP